jgi:hypothetical protein
MLLVLYLNLLKAENWLPNNDLGYYDPLGLRPSSRKYYFLGIVPLLFHILCVISRDFFIAGDNCCFRK